MGHRRRDKDGSSHSSTWEFEITQAMRDTVQRWIKQAGLRADDFLFPSHIHDSPRLGTRQDARILEGRVEGLGPDPAN